MGFFMFRETTKVWLFAFCPAFKSFVNISVTSFNKTALLQLFFRFAFPSRSSYIFSGGECPVKIWGSCKERESWG